MEEFSMAKRLLDEFKGDNYVYGIDVLPQLQKVMNGLGRKVFLVRDRFPGSDDYVNQIRDALGMSGAEIIGEVDGSAPNAPREDLLRITEAIKQSGTDVVISFGGGSTVDAVKAAIVLVILGGKIDDYFGTGLISQALSSTGKTLITHIAIQTASSSGAHLTKYSNITEIKTGQKKLIVDDAIIPPMAIFDYAVTFGAPPTLTADGALDGISHALEVLYSAVGKPAYAKVLPVSLEAIRLVLAHLPGVLAKPTDPVGREALGLATDLGAYAIMLGGTNGAHLTSFSLVDILSHGRACGMLNPYYTVFFAPAVEEALHQVAAIYFQEGYIDEDPDQLSGRQLGLAAAQAMINFQKRIGFPTKMEEVPGFSAVHIKRALEAAKNPQLKMKLENMPIPMTSEMVDEYMAPILQAARTGDLSLIKNMESDQ